MSRVAKEICIPSSCPTAHIHVRVPALAFGANVVTLRRLKMKNKNSFKDDIELAERNILIVSWCGVLSAIGVIIWSIL